MFDRSWTVNCPPNAGPIVVSIPLTLPGGSPDLELSAWTGGVVANNGNALILEGEITAGEVAAELAESTGAVDCLLVVPRGGVASVRIPSDIQDKLSVFFDSSIGANQVVQVRIRSLA